MRQMLPKIDLIGAGGEVNNKMEGTWITGIVLGKMIGAAGRGLKPKQKVVYDHTTAFGSSFRLAGALSQMSKKSQNMSQGLCIFER